MQVGKNKVVTIDYTLKAEDGTLLDKSEAGEPLAYIHGIGNLIPGVEKALEGKGSGENVKIMVSPEEGYGVRNEALVQTMPKSQFDFVDEVSVGMQFQAQDPSGQPVILTVTGVEGEEVTLDGNHPLAGLKLDFDITVADIRDATSEELDHGHVHGPGGHHH